MSGSYSENALSGKSLKEYIDGLRDPQGSAKELLTEANRVGLCYDHFGSGDISGDISSGYLMFDPARGKGGPFYFVNASDGKKLTVSQVSFDKAMAFVQPEGQLPIRHPKKPSLGFWGSLRNAFGFLFGKPEKQKQYEREMDVYRARKSALLEKNFNFPKLSYDPELLDDKKAEAYIWGARDPYEVGSPKVSAALQLLDTVRARPDMKVGSTLAGADLLKRMINGGENTPERRSLIDTLAKISETLKNSPEGLTEGDYQDPQLKRTKEALEFLCARTDEQVFTHLRMPPMEILRGWVRQETANGSLFSVNDIGPSHDSIPAQNEQVGQKTGPSGAGPLQTEHRLDTARNNRDVMDEKRVEDAKKMLAEVTRGRDSKTLMGALHLNMVILTRHDTEPGKTLVNYLAGIRQSQNDPGKEPGIAEKQNATIIRLCNDAFLAVKDISTEEADFSKKTAAAIDGVLYDTLLPDSVQKNKQVLQPQKLPENQQIDKQTLTD